ncbi:porin [Alsobacter sp. SYSU M60028]|uniref:Porin n=1 Tax=Alsobacter ponti TaxID=2962936 RepID=A0ABT1LF42_9HYPH|nr:porin [Alsobacter ponti]MCP8940112.1 porin [Alsobacter ponti]
MKLMKSLLLGTAAGFAAVAGAQAADLPTKKAAPVEYVRVCSQFGAGFFYIPGSDTCLKVSGRVRADYFYNEPLARSSNTTSTRARGYLALDSYTATDWGPVRATTRVYVTKDSGSSATTTLDWAYIQFAGVTAGRIATSFFEFAPFGGVSFFGGGANGRGSDYGAINTLAYTYNAGNGFLATIALEDGTERRVGMLNEVFNPVAPNAAGYYGGIYGATSSSYGGHVMPDIVGRLEYGGSWGVATLTGAVHQTRTNFVSGAPLNPNGPVAEMDSEWGFAIQGGVKVNLPMLAAGDALFLQAAYADGASSYTGWGPSNGIANATALGGYDVYVDAYGNAKTAKSWSITGGIEHYWIPTLSTALFAAYGQFNGGTVYNANIPVPVGGTPPGSYQDDWAVFSIGANVKWTPVRNLLLGAEVVYQKATDVPTNFLYPTTGPGAGRQEDIWSGRLRVQRDF